MVTMVPDMISEDVKSNAERRLFDNFKHTNTSQNITILHSLGLAKHRDKVVGEIDFVVLCNRGILVLEVKGGKVEREAGGWYFTNRYNEKNKKNEGPFEQANGNMHSLENALEARLDRNDPIRNCFYANAVIMPDCDFHGDDPSINRDILFDRSNYKGLLDVIEKSFDYWEGIHRSKHGERRFSQLSAEDIKRIEVILRGDFSFIPLMSDIIDQTYESLASLTEEQYDILSGMNDNDRLLVSGCAGSGKTLLAKEEYCRAIAEGKNALFLCYNKLFLFNR